MTCDKDQTLSRRPNRLTGEGEPDRSPRVRHITRFQKYMSSIEIYEAQGIKYVRKTVEPPFLGSRRMTPLCVLARTMCALEVRALRRLRGIKGVIQFVRQDSPTSFITLHEKSTSLAEAPTLTPTYFDKLQTLFNLIHQRGVVDLDLVHRSDIRVTPSGDPIVMDFGLALTCAEPRKGLRKALFMYLCRQHHIHRLRIKEEYFPRHMTPSEKTHAHRLATLPRAQTGIHQLRALPLKIWNSLLGGTHGSRP